MAAAAIASGAAESADDAGAGEVVTETGTATATGVGVVVTSPSCWARRGSMGAASVSPCASCDFGAGDLAGSEEEGASVGSLVLPAVWLFPLPLVVAAFASVEAESPPLVALLESVLVC